MAEMIKFYRGLLNNLPTSGASGAIYITTDEGAIYLGTGTGMKRLGDFVQVDAVANLPTDGANTSALYYCVAENVLAKWNGTSWTQVNKQPTAEEMKTLLGLGSLAYLSEVTESNLSSELAEKVNAAADGNHSHSNKTVLDGITAEKVAAWDASEQNAKDYADGLDEAMNARVEALEAIDHEHANKELLDTYTQTEANLADAVAKKHEHANAAELDKILEGDKAKWDAVAADHLTSADKTTLENAIKEAKKAGTDANTALETYKVSNDARVLAVEEDVAEITNSENGILAQAKTYSDGKLATARTEITAEIDADVKVVNDALEAYKTANDTALAGVKATAEAAATKEYTDAELAKKVDKVDGKSLVADTEIARLAAMSDGANKVEASETNGNIKIDGVETVVYTHPEKHAIADVDGLQTALDGLQAKGDYAAAEHTHTKAEITDFAHTHTASEITDLDTTIKGYDYATKTELGDVDAKFANYKTAEAQKAIDDEQDRRLGVIEGDYVKAADIANFETKANVKKVADDLAAYVASNDEALAGVKATAEAARTEEEVDAQIDAKITALNLATTYEPIGAEDRAKAYADGLITTANLDQYTTEDEVKSIVDGVIASAADSETYNSLTKLVDYIDTHGGEATEMAQAIDTLEGKVEVIEGKVEAIEAKPAYAITAEQIANWENEVGAKAIAESKTTTEEVKAQIEAYGYATTEEVAAEQSAREAKDAELAEAIEAAKTEASNQDAVVLAEAQANIEAAKTAVISEAATDAQAKVDALAETVYTKAEVEALLSAAQSWGEF